MYLCSLYKLPFHVTMKIMEYNPRLPYMPRSIVLSKHFAKKYCKYCGNYIEGKLHAHETRPTFRPKLYKYMSVNLSLLGSVNKKQMIHCKLRQYLRMFNQEYQIPIRAVFLKTGILYYYNFKAFCNLRSKTIIPMVDIRQFNIFHNPNFYTVSNFISEYPQYNYAEIFYTFYFSSFNRNYYIKDSPEHEIMIHNIMTKIIKYSHHFMNFFYSSMAKYESILYNFLTMDIESTMKVLINNQSPDTLFLKAIEFNLKCIDYLEEKKLSRLFYKNRRFFIDLYDTVKEAKDYFTLLNVMDDTLNVRMCLLE